MRIDGYALNGSSFTWKGISNRMSGIFLKILDMGYAAGWLMAAVILARLLLKKAPRRIICLLWALAAVRLLCPFSIKSAFSLIPDSRPLTDVAVREISLTARTLPQNNYLSVRDNISRPEGKEGDIPEQPEYDVMDVLPAVWAAGVVLMLVYGINGYYRIKRRTGASIPVRENIMKCDAVDTPFILGVLRPRIFLPSGMEDFEMEYVVAHERAHIKRRDHWWKPMGFLILCVYWFHPLCWVSYMLFCRDLELACDESVVRTMNMEDKKAYAKALLSYSMNRSRIAAYPLAFGEVGVKERVRSVLNYKKPAFWMIAVSAAIGIVVAVCFLTDPERKKEEGQPPVLPATEELVRISVKNGCSPDGMASQVIHITETEQIEALVSFLAEAEWTDRVTAYDYPRTEAEVTEIQLITLHGEIYSIFGYLEDGIFYIEQPYQGIWRVSSQITDVLENQSIENAGVETQSMGSGMESPELLIDRWAQAFVNCDRETIVLLATPEVKDNELDRMISLMSSGIFGGYNLGWSCPWPTDVDTDYTVYIYEDIGMAEIYYYAWTGGPHGYVWRETLTYERQGDVYVVTGDEVVSYHNISSGAEYAAAYPGGIDGTMMDYTWNGLGEALNDNAVADNDVYKALLSPESAAVYLLNLSPDPEDVSISVHDDSEGSGMVGLDILFLQDQYNVTISMIQPYGMNGIWVPVDYRIDVVSRFMDIPWDEIEAIPDVGYYDSSRLNNVICIGEIPDYDIRVYGYNDEEISGRGVAIDIAGDVNYFDWFYTSPRNILPDLYWDEDERVLWMAFHTFTGTGVSAEELVILQHYDTGTLVPYYFGYDDYTELLSERIGYDMDYASRELTLIDRETDREAASVTVSEGEITGIECGSISWFELGDSVKFFVGPGFYREGSAIPEYEDMPFLEFELEYEWVSIASGGTEISFALGDLTGVWFINEK